MMPEVCTWPDLSRSHLMDNAHLAAMDLFLSFFEGFADIDKELSLQ
jgi:hypothetical protein